ncbi:MAG: RHS repeat domain-containing protein [Casimicrobiaceae bacterium]
MSYDTAVNGVGKLASMTDPSGTTTYTYDTNGRVATKTQTTLGIPLQLSFTRDSLGRVTSVVYPSGKTLAVTYTGDRMGSLPWNGGRCCPASSTSRSAAQKAGFSAARSKTPAPRT